MVGHSNKKYIVNGCISGRPRGYATFLLLWTVALVEENKSSSHGVKSPTGDATVTNTLVPQRGDWGVCSNIGVCGNLQCDVAVAEGGVALLFRWMLCAPVKIVL